MIQDARAFLSTIRELSGTTAASQEKEDDINREMTWARLNGSITEEKRIALRETFNEFRGHFRDTDPRQPFSCHEDPFPVFYQEPNPSDAGVDPKDVMTEEKLVAIQPKSLTSLQTPAVDMNEVIRDFNHSMWQN